VEGERIVHFVFDGWEPPRPPVHESEDKRFEASLSDLLRAGVRVADWEFFEVGGPSQEGGRGFHSLPDLWLYSSRDSSTKSISISIGTPSLSISQANYFLRI